ncbi:MAG: hypothetical protein A2381_12470 [Bdellovibrionales bacterium RIFOXYB1_FULL_37_110]|nr:MAG: hypothetical protein A2417_14470 [Bdellovibrionales bacterium RIFOXYC1_FULL_37_79]OFZ57546.1 MAG: hypothetical protein A2381_12470 [Bdellovibrionales bacterium RIFOXYB1_FULL_37_110]
MKIKSLIMKFETKMVHTAKVSKYDFDSTPDFDAIGKQIDKVIKEHYINRKIAIRCISSDDHPDFNIIDLILKIKEIGTDRYDPKRVGDRYDNIEGKNIDIFALDFHVLPDAEMMKYLIEPFYSWPIKFGRNPIKIDLVIIYDLNQLEMVEHQYIGRDDLKKDGFIFKYPDRKDDALLGIIKIENLI